MCASATNEAWGIFEHQNLLLEYIQLCEFGTVGPPRKRGEKWHGLSQRNVMTTRWGWTEAIAIPMNQIWKKLSKPLLLMLFWLNWTPCKWAVKLRSHISQDTCKLTQTPKANRNGRRNRRKLSNQKSHEQKALQRKGRSATLFQYYISCSLKKWLSNVHNSSIVKGDV